MEIFKPIVKKYLAELYTELENYLDKIILEHKPTDMIVNSQVGGFISDFIEPFDTNIDIIKISEEVDKNGIYKFGEYKGLNLYINSNMTWNDKRVYFYKNLKESIDIAKDKQEYLLDHYLKCSFIIDYKDTLL